MKQAIPILLCVLGTILGCNSQKSEEQPKKADQSTNEKIVGPWEMTRLNGGPAPVHYVYEFTQSGKFNRRLNSALESRDGSYRIEGDQLTISSRTKEGEAETNTFTIKSLSADSMILVHEKNDQVEFKKRSN